MGRSPVPSTAGRRLGRRRAPEHRNLLRAGLEGGQPGNIRVERLASAHLDCRGRTSAFSRNVERPTPDPR
jgi:hypothetical protein